jgi:hypothetical protein
MALQENRGRAPGGVISELRLALQQQHPSKIRQFESCRGTSDPAAYDDEVMNFHNAAEMKSAPAAGL